MGQRSSPEKILYRAFSGITESEAQEFIDRGEVKSYPAGTILCHEDRYESTFYIILEGEVSVTKVINADQKRWLKSLSAGDFFGEMALIHDAPRAATVTCTTAVTMLEISKEAFQKLIRHSTSLSIAVAREVSRRLRQNDEMAIEDLRVKAGELAAAYQQLAEQEYARREFLTTIAHELRTPLTAASGFLQLINSGQLPPEALKAALESVSRNIQQIVTLVNDILFLQEMDLILPRFVAVDVGTLVKTCVEAHQGAASANQVKLVVDVAPDLPQAAGDTKSLERAISAILDNAIKFSPNGGDVIITAEAVEHGISIAIQDHGVGIPAEVLKRVFDRFFHVDQVGEHLFRGVGLGLSIARQVIEQHGGRIAVRSEVGQGCLVTIMLHPYNG